jgi:N-acyl-L-homoserine lactone synthetase
MQTFPEVSQSRPPDAVLRAMFEARKRVFVDLLKWNVPVLAGAYELDQFDTPDAEYLVLADQENRHRASARLLRTDRPHILGELFARLCDGPVPQRPDLKEITRFCIEPTLARFERRVTRDQLVVALVDHALASGLSGYTAVAGRGWFRQIAGFGWQCRALGPDMNVGGERLVAIEIDIDSTTPAALAQNGIHRRVPCQHAGSLREMVS